MKLREIKIKNFRCLVDVTFPIEDATVLVGENNSGKTSLLEALRIALPQRSVGKGNPFGEYDYHMSKMDDSPQTSEGIYIELRFQEDSPDEWEDSLIQALNEIVQTDPVNDIDSIILRLSSVYDSLSNEYVSKWEFLAINGQPIQGKGANSANLTKFLNYVRLFHLSALRDVNNEFSTKSQYWGRILKDLKISEGKQKQLSDELARLNSELMNEDQRLKQVTESLNTAQKILALETGQHTSIQALPLKPWELMAKSEVVVRGRGGEIDFPLSQHGQGTQSLAVLFLFQAYIDILLKPSFQPETEAILTLEELEAHLHPQAIRALANNLNKLKSQKIISSHSPYFIEGIPFTQIRMFRRNGAFSKVLYIKRFYSVKLPNIPEIINYCRKHSPKYLYNVSTNTLEVHGKIDESEYRDLLMVYAANKEVHEDIKYIFKESQLYLSDEIISDIENYTKRIRGEILFARAWILCEGQSEYLIIRYFAELLGTPLDQKGVSVIDFQNNGSPGAFVSLARVFEIPWIMFCDNDQAGKDFKKQIEDLGINDQEIQELVYPLEGTDVDIETFLFFNGFEEEYKSVLIDLHKPSNEHIKEWYIARTHENGEFLQIKHKADSTLEVTTIAKGEQSKTYLESDPSFRELFVKIVLNELKSDKVRYMDSLIKKLKANEIDKERVPKFFSSIISKIIGKVV